MIGFNSMDMQKRNAIPIRTETELLLHLLLEILTILSLILGNLIAITQTSMKSMLAYSSIGQIEYVIIGTIVGDSNDVYDALCLLSLGGLPPLAVINDWMKPRNNHSRVKLYKISFKIKIKQFHQIEYDCTCKTSTTPPGISMNPIIAIAHDTLF
ncbi:hypothetical protein M9H77_33828 [Catharanthus roseus]|uniref:Uncharacterized protein n=1 Tax=Catharanthus roseus TaxID=4058 RepID=A0ACB9ZJU7_CATRO|nr:hypothetical protein M9H77_33828 [Catharanthus roseus]